MDRRFALALVLSFCVLLVFQIWIAPKSKRRGPLRTADSTLSASPRSGLDTARIVAASPGRADSAASLSILSDSLLAAAADLPEEILPIHTKSVDASFTNRGGRIASWVLKEYKTYQGTPVEMLHDEGELGLVLETEKGILDLREVPFRHRLESGPKGEQVIVFETATSGGLRVTKRYTVPPEGYLVGLEVEITGDDTMSEYRLTWDRALPRVEHDPRIERLAGGTIVLMGNNLNTFRPVSFRRVSEKEVAGNVRWAGVRNKYFVAAMVPPAETSSRVVATGSAATLETGAQLVMPLLRGEGRHVFQVYIGPLDYSHLKTLGLGLDRAVNLGYKFVRPLSQLLLASMEWLFRFIPNFGVVIIIISALTKLIFYPLTRSSVRSMKALQVLQPEINALRDKYKGDPQRLQRETMNLYKENKVNPMGGCIPMLVQMPVFIALYAVLANCIELRQAPFMLWIQDLSTPDVLFTAGSFPIHVLPVVMFFTTLLQQKLTPISDPKQKLMGYMMPVMMLFIFYSFPAGLNLYWTVNNVLTVAQQWQIHREVAQEARA